MPQKTSALKGGEDDIPKFPFKKVALRRSQGFPSNHSGGTPKKAPKCTPKCHQRFFYRNDKFWVIICRVGVFSGTKNMFPTIMYVENGPFGD